MLPSSGAMVLQASGPERREAGLDQRDRGLALGEVGAIGQDVRGKHAGLAGLLAQFLHQIVARAVRTRPRILLIRRPPRCG